MLSIVKTFKSNLKEAGEANRCCFQIPIKLFEIHPTLITGENSFSMKKFKIKMHPKKRRTHQL